MLSFNFSIANNIKWYNKYTHLEPWRIYTKKWRVRPFNYLLFEISQFHPLSLFRLLQLTLSTEYEPITGSRFLLSLTAFGIVIELRLWDIRPAIWDPVSMKYIMEERYEQL